MTIADDPRVRDAEINGWGPADDDPDYSEQVELLKDAEELLNQAADRMLDVEDDLKPEKLDNFYRETMYRIWEIATDIRCAQDRLERGEIE